MFIVFVFFVEPTLFHSGDDGGEVIVQQDHIRSVFCGVRAGDSHCNTDICLLQSWRIVYSVSCYCYDGALRETVTYITFTSATHLLLSFIIDFYMSKTMSIGCVLVGCIYCRVQHILYIEPKRKYSVSINCY